MRHRLNSVVVVTAICVAVFAKTALCADAQALCFPIESLDATVERSSGPITTLQKVSFQTAGRKGVAIARSYQPFRGEGSDSILVHATDFVLGDAEGKLCRVGFSDDLIELEEFKGVPLRPGTDSILVVAHPLMATGAFYQLYWLLLYNPTSHRWTGLYLNNQPRQVALPTIDQKLNWDDPAAEPERQYLDKLKFRYGYITKEMVLNNENPEHSRLRWVLENSDVAARKSSGTLKLHWYPATEKECASASSDLVFGDYRLKGPITTSICDMKNKKWSWLFIADGYKEDSFDVSAPKLSIQQLTIQTRERTFAVDLKTFHWQQ
jgi:hypothetical protein